MSNIKVIADKEEIVAIADTVRSKTGSSNTIKGLTGIANAINGINSGYISPSDELVRVVIQLGEQTSGFVNGPIFDENGNLMDSNADFEDGNTYYLNLTFPYVFEARHDQGYNGSIASFNIISGDAMIYLDSYEVALMYIGSDATIQIEASPQEFWG